jgi:hypothetical protein
MLLSFTRRLGSGNRLGIAVARGRTSGDRHRCRNRRVDTATARRESALPPQDCGTSVSVR